MSTISDAAQALAGLLRAAEDGALPLPTSAEAMSYPPHDRDLTGVGSLSLLVAGLDDLAAWSTWLDEPIDDTREPYRGRVHCVVRGMAGPVPVRVTALVAPGSRAISRGMIGPRLTLDDLRHARDLYGGTLIETAGAWTLVGAVMAGTPVTLGPVRA